MTTYAIVHKPTNRLLLLPHESGGNNKIVLTFKYPIQAHKYIQNKLGNSIAFRIVAFPIEKKKKESVIKCQPMNK